MIKPEVSVDPSLLDPTKSLYKSYWRLVQADHPKKGSHDPKIGSDNPQSKLYLLLLHKKIKHKEVLMDMEADLKGNKQYFNKFQLDINKIEFTLKNQRQLKALLNVNMLLSTALNRALSSVPYSCAL